MPCRKLSTILVVVSAVVLTFGASPDSPWPLAKGACWLYRTDVQAQQPAGQNGILATQMTWRMEVIDTYRRGPIQATLLRGHPADLAFYAPGTQPAFWVLARSGNSYYVLHDPAAWTRLHDPADALTGLIGASNQFFSFPLKRGDLFGQDPRRDDTFYGWYVEEVRPADLSAISNPPTLTDGQEYVLTNRTISGTETVTLVPGIGITHYVYHHSGTVSDVDAVLVEMRQAATHGRKASKVE